MRNQHLQSGEARTLLALKLTTSSNPNQQRAVYGPDVHIWQAILDPPSKVAYPGLERNFARLLLKGAATAYFDGYDENGRPLDNHDHRRFLDITSRGEQFVPRAIDKVLKTMRRTPEWIQTTEKNDLLVPELPEGFEFTQAIGQLLPLEQTRPLLQIVTKDK